MTDLVDLPIGSLRPAIAGTACTVAQTLDDSTQYVYDPHARQFSADTQADIYGNGTSNSVFLRQINPGDSVTGRIYFDMPANDKAVKAVLHDSMFSGGITVSLAKHGG